MKSNSLQIIDFDRVTNRVSAPSWPSLLQVKLLQWSHKLLKPLKYLGVSRIHGLINRIVNLDSSTVVREGKFEFRFPSNDYYWNRLLDNNFEYEIEIDQFLNQYSSLPFVFLDLGANFGYWTSRLSAGLYGEHKVIAVEASKSCFGILQQNVRGEGNEVSLHHKAIDDESGKELTLYGERHAGFSIDSTWYGASDEVAGKVESICIDDLVELEQVDANNTPIIVKLDVEGVEMRALQGAANVVSGLSAFIIEDAEKQGISDAVLFAKEKLGLDFFYLENKTIREVSLDDIMKIKRTGNTLQGIGLNLIATKSDYWKEKLRRSTS
ncbi:MAG: FkbM family methyltransferase [Pseudomonadota bacterium]